MTSVKVLVEGYVREENDVEFASSAATLIRDKELNIITDPGMNRALLLEKLEQEGLSSDDINYVVLTHTHLDHCLLAGMFANAKIVDDSSVYGFDGKIEDHEEKIPGTDIEIIKTPGHDQFHCAVLVNDEKLGKVAIAGDVFWWGDDEREKANEELICRKDPYVKNEEQLNDSRRKLLGVADYIIPGHGKMFKVEK